jgi:hypothetical protein
MVSRRSILATHHNLRPLGVAEAGGNRRGKPGTQGTGRSAHNALEPKKCRDILRLLQCGSCGPISGVYYGSDNATRHNRQPHSEQDRSPLAFERFCVKHYTAAEGILYVPTSYNYDNGRDARTEFNVRGRGTSYICSSCTTADVEAKAEDDLKMLLRHDARPGKVRFCFTAAVTEVKRDRILKVVRKLAPHALVRNYAGT